MAFGLFILLNAVLFIRPAELVPALNDLPLYEALILLCTVVSLPQLIRTLTAEPLGKMPVLVGVLVIWASIVLSHLTYFRTFEAREEAAQFFKVVLYYLLLVTNVSSKERLHRFVLWLSVFTISMTVSSRSSVNFFTKGLPSRAVTFQSIARISSPGWYSRTSSKFIPRPLKTLW